MDDADRFRPLGKHRTPRARLGAFVRGEVRGEIEVVGFSGGPIRWPLGKTSLRLAEAKSQVWRLMESAEPGRSSVTVQPPEFPCPSQLSVTMVGGRGRPALVKQSWRRLVVAASSRKPPAARQAAGRSTGIGAPAWF